VRIRQYVNDLPMACDTDAVEQWKSTVQTFIDERGDKELKVETMKTSLSVLNALLNRAATHGGIEKHKVAKFNLMEKSPLATFVPTWDLKVGNENTRTAYSAAEFREICQHVDLDKPELATIFTFFYMTGLRLSEGWNLTKKKIDTGSDHPFLRLSPEAQDIKSEAGKRNIPLNSSAQMVRDQILAMSNDSDFFIPRIVSSHNKLSAAFKRALVRAAAVEGSAMWQKVERPRSEDDVIGCFHCLRNSYATNVANNSNVTLSQAMRWIGHSDAKTTNKYVKVSDNEHKAAEAL